MGPLEILAAVHTLRLAEKLTINPGEDILPGEYITENILGAQLVTLAGEGALNELKEFRPFDEDKDWNGKSILLFRAGGFGDVVNLTPSIREIKRRWPRCRVAVASMGDYGSVLQNLPYEVDVLKYPVSVADADQYDAWVFFENAIEKNLEAEKLHMADLFAKIIGLTFPKFGSKWDGKPDYVVTAEEAAWAKVQFPRKPNMKRMCIQAAASAQCRVYPFEMLTKVLNHFKDKKSWELYLMGAKGEVSMQEMENVFDLANKGLTFRQSCAVVSACDVLVGSDSSLVHIAGAIGVPTVAMYGPFPWKLRTAYYPSVHALQGKGRCSPCFYHESLGRLKRDPFPAKCPSRAKGFCEVLATITPQQVIAKAEKIARPLKAA